MTVSLSKSECLASPTFWHFRYDSASLQLQTTANHYDFHRQSLFQILFFVANNPNFHRSMPKSVCANSGVRVGGEAFLEAKGKVRQGQPCYLVKKIIEKHRKPKLPLFSLSQVLVDCARKSYII